MARWLWFGVFFWALAFAPLTGRAASSINTTLPIQGQPYNAGPIRQNFIAAAQDIAALQSMNAGPTAPASPTTGTFWLNTGSTTYVLNIWIGATSAWVPIASIDSTTGIWEPPMGGGVLPTLASAATTDLGSVPQAAVYISGSQSIASFGSSAPPGQVKYVSFTGSPTLVYNAATMILPRAANLPVTPGTQLVAVSLGSGAWQGVSGSSVALAAGATPFTPTATSLGQLSSTYSAYVLRGDVPVVYASSASACTLNAGLGDGGSQIPSSDGKCWLAQVPAAGADAAMWGVSTGATDNSTALAAALTWSCTAAKPVLIAAGTYDVSSVAQIGNGTSSSLSTLNGCVMRAVGVGLAQSEAIPATSPVTILWTGAANGTVFKVAGPISAVHLGGIKVDCNNLCTTGFDFETPVSSTFHDLLVERYVNGPAYVINSAPTFSGFATGTQHDTFTNVRAENPGTCGDGIAIGPSSVPSGDIDDPAQNVFQASQFVFDASCNNTYGIKLQFTDNQTFIETATGPQGTGGTGTAGLLIAPPSGNTGFPQETTFINSAILGGVVVSGTWTATHGIGFFPYPTADGETPPSSTTRGQLYGFLSDGTPFGGLTSSTLQFNSGATALALAGSTYYIGSGCARADRACQLVMPYNGWIRNLLVSENVAPGASQHVTLTIYKNDATTTPSITCTITDPGNTCGDTTDAIQVSQGDVVTLQAVGSAGAASGLLIGTLEYDR